MLDPKLDLFRHTLATLAYRAGRCLDGAPEEFATFRVSPETRTPAQILAHLGDLLDWGLSLVKGKQKWHDSVPLAWPDEVARFFRALQTLDESLTGPQPTAFPVERLFQGPIADALTHVGQIAMLRRISGSAAVSENFFRAEITVGRVGQNQAKAVQQFS